MTTLVKQRKKRAVLTDEELASIALQYSTKSELREAHPSIRGIAKKRGIWDKICAHMPKRVSMAGKNNPAFKWTFEKLIIEALKYKTKKSFEDGSAGAYLAALKHDSKNIIFSHMPINVNIGKSPPNKKWTLEKIQEEGLKYSNRNDFLKSSPSAYAATLKMGGIDKIHSHMEPSKSSNAIPYTLEEIFIESLNYNTRSEFFNKNPAVYSAAWRSEYFEDICFHMKTSRGSSLPELELMAIIKDIYPSAKKIRDMKVKIKDKPYIYGFELDVLIPELNKAIEFDGKYHHSPEGLLQYKKENWPLEDTLNKAQIKDDWFMSSKGIEVLHINEVDWIKDKEKCIQKCFEFLKGSTNV